MPPPSSVPPEKRPEALVQRTAGSEPVRHPLHGPAGECAPTQLVEHADDIFDVDLAGGGRVPSSPALRTTPGS